MAFGSFNKSSFKPRAKKANLDILFWAKRNIKKPVVAIGGINNLNYKKFLKLEQNILQYQVLFGITQI